MMSPVAARNPAARAAPLPRVGSRTILTSDGTAVAAATVPSVERPSTTITSWSPDGSRARTVLMSFASLSAGITTEICGERPAAFERGVTDGLAGRSVCVSVMKGA
jgi:hypothetical protein